MPAASVLSYRRAPRSRPLVGLVTVLSFVATLPGCTVLRYKPMALKEMNVERDKLVKRRIRVTSAAGESVTLQIDRVVYPFVFGTVREGSGEVQVRTDEIKAMAAVHMAADQRLGGEDRSYTGPFAPVSHQRLTSLTQGDRRMALRLQGGEVWIAEVTLSDTLITGKAIKGKPSRVDLRQASTIEVGEYNNEMSLLASLGALAGGVLALGVIVALTKESCPFVYVDRGRGPELVGEAYPGAAFRSVQRDDLLDLGRAPGATVRVRLRNEARETQFTDRAELMVIDHEPGLAAVATHDARILMLGDTTPPLVARVEGRDVTAELARADGRFWERDVVTAANSSDRPTEDSIVVDLPIPAAGGIGTPQAMALDLKIGNTPLVDLVFGRFFAAMGQDLKKFVSTGNDAASATRIRNWLTREGVNLTAEVDDGTGFRVVAVIPPTGPAALRRIAIPVQVAAGEKRLRVRLSGGVGFWRFDGVGLAAIQSAGPRIAMVAPSSALSSREGVALAEVAKSDGVYNALETLDESLDLTFAPPPPAEGRHRSIFLSTTGYYNVHPPVESRRQIGLLRRVSDRPGALSQLGLDLVRDYVRAAELAPRAADQGGPQ
jgi:hypothetical protein